MSWLEASARWYAVLLLLTWGWAPLVRLLLWRLPDGGASVVRPLALLGVVYPSWLVASLGLLPYSTAGLWVTLAVGAAVGWALVLRRGAVDRAWLRSLLVVEALSLVAFFGYVWLRGFTPELLGTEKPMDAAFLSSSARTTAMPPPDPWFAGEPINYYYLGYLLHGALTRLAGVVSTTGFNLALATTFSSALVAAAGVGFDAARPWFSRRRAAVVGALAAVLLVGIGNLYAAVRLLQTPRETFGAWWWDKEYGVGWRASRIVCDGARVANDCPRPAVETINEFPFFSFLLGDLHPHVMALPLTIVALALALNLLLRGIGPAGGRNGDLWATFIATGAVVGSLYALNSWDFPTYLLVVLAAAWIGLAGREEGRRATAALVLVAASVVAWLPFVVRFVPPVGAGAPELPAVLRDLPVVPSLLTAVAIHPGERTSTGEFLTMFGIPYGLGLWLIGSGARRRRAEGGNAASRFSAVAAVIGLLVPAVLLSAPLLFVCGVPLVAAVAALGRDRSPAARTIATGLFALGFALVIAVELFYIRDAFGDRMNTLFKVYYQVWTLFAFAGALACVVIWREARPRRVARPALFAYVAIALAAGAAYPALASYRWTDEFAGWDGLDGLAYVDSTAPDELAALRWLQANARHDDVLAEAPGCAYRPPGDVPFNRAAAYTGAPTVIGWNNHQRQWRSGQPALIAAIGPREEDVAGIFAEPRGELLDRYGVTLLYVGRYERADYDPGCDIADGYPAVKSPGYPGDGWEIAFAQGDVRIFRRIQTAT